MWAGAEQQLAARAREYRPRELAGFARDLITTLDQDGPEPDHGDEEQVNELYLATRPGGAGGRITGVFDAPSFDALRTALDALCDSRPPKTSDPSPNAAATDWPNCAANASTPATCPPSVGNAHTW